MYSIYIHVYMDNRPKSGPISRPWTLLCAKSCAPLTCPSPTGPGFWSPLWIKIIYNLNGKNLPYFITLVYGQTNAFWTRSCATNGSFRTLRYWSKALKLCWEKGIKGGKALYTFKLKDGFAPSLHCCSVTHLSSLKNELLNNIHQQVWLKVFLLKMCVLVHSGFHQLLQ